MFVYKIHVCKYYLAMHLSCSYTARTTGLTVTLQLLMDKCQLTISQVNREIQQKDVSYLAAYFDNVELYVDAMELSPDEQSYVLIKRLESNHLAMIKCLNIWKRKKLSQATFRALLEMLVKLKKGAIAEQICRYINVSVCVSVCLNLYVELFLMAPNLINGVSALYVCLAPYTPEDLPGSNNCFV